MAAVSRNDCLTNGIGRGTPVQNMNIQAPRNASQLQPRVERILKGLVDGGYELGVQAAVYLDGELVVDVCVGRVTSDSDAVVKPDTVFPVCSTGKGILATIVHILAERGLIDYDAPIATYWPEFGSTGKRRLPFATRSRTRRASPSYPCSARSTRRATSTPHPPESRS